MTDTTADFAVTTPPTTVERPRSVFRRAYLGVGHVLRAYEDRVVSSQYGIPDGSVAAAAKANPKL